MDLPDFLVENEFGDIRIRGRRLSLYHVLLLREQGLSAQQISAEYELQSTLVDAILQFCEAHRPEVEAFVAKYEAEMDRIVKDPAVKKLDLNELQKRLAERSLKAT